MSGEASGLKRSHIVIICAAAGLLLITMGMRQSLGLFVRPITDSTTVSYAAMSFALAVGQLMWGVSQPVFGMLTEKFGPGRILLWGGLLLSAGTALTPFFPNGWALLVTLGFFTAFGAGAGSFSLIFGVVMQRVPADQRSFAAGFVNAGGSAGQSLFAFLGEKMIKAAGWMNSMWVLAGAALLTLPLARTMLRKPAESAATVTAAAVAPVKELTIREQLRIAARDKSYWCLHLGFFTCGFHIAFLVTHLPGEVGLCGLPSSVAASALIIIGLANIAGSLTAGWAGSVMRMKYVLFTMYFSRAVIVLIYMAAPKTPTTFYIFAAVLGFTWLATVPPTAGLVGKLFGIRHLATLFGLAMLTHQIGAFFGASLGGLAMKTFGDFTWMWYADAALAVAAAFINLPIREAPVRRIAVPA